MKKIKLAAILDVLSTHNGFISEDLKNALILADDNGLCDESSPLLDRDWILTDNRKVDYSTAPLSEEAEAVLLLRAKCGDKKAIEKLLTIHKNFLYTIAKELQKRSLGDVAYTDIEDCRQSVAEIFLEKIKRTEICCNGHIIKAITLLDYKTRTYATKNIAVGGIKTEYNLAVKSIYNFIKANNKQDGVIKVSREAVKDAADTLRKSGKRSICNPDIHPDDFARFIDNATNYINGNFSVISGNQNYGQEDNSATTLFDSIVSDAKSTEDAAIAHVVDDMFIDSNSPSLIMRAMAQFGDSRDIQIFVDVKVKEMSYKDVMSKYGITSENTIKSILTRTASKIKKAMQLMDAEETTMITKERGVFKTSSKKKTA